MGFQNATQTRGYLALIGGGEDKQDGSTVLRCIVDLNAARNAVIIPTASAYGAELGEEYVAVFREVGVDSARVLDVRYADQAKNPTYLDQVAQADLIFFTGGDQVRLVKVLNNTPLIARIRERFAAGATVAGTSAGAAAASDPMIYDGDGYGFSKGSVQVAEGFGFLEGVTIDTHFVSRGRIARLTQFLASGRSSAGLGLADDTAVVVTPDCRAMTLGSGVVTALSSRDIEYSSYHDIDHHEHITVDGIRLSFLAAGAVFDLKTWSFVGTHHSELQPCSGTNA